MRAEIVVQQPDMISYYAVSHIDSSRSLTLAGLGVRKDVGLRFEQRALERQRLDAAPMYVELGDGFACVRFMPDMDEEL